MDYPQVALFGSVQGGWREKYIIPVLEELQVSYFNPVALTGDWTRARGDREAEVMAHCETIVMVINRLSPAFSGLAETGWAALGALQRGQHFILQIDQDAHYALPEGLREVDGAQDLQRQLQHYITASRYLVYHHAQHFEFDRLHLVEDPPGGNCRTAPDLHLRRSGPGYNKSV